MKRLLALAVILIAASVAPSKAQSPIVPKGWIDIEQLEQALVPLQEQLDTGKAMLQTAWSMAAVKDAALFVTYIALCEKLPDKERETLRKEQEKWLGKRKKAAAAADDGKSGQIGRLQAATEFQDQTDARSTELKARLAKK